MAAARDKLGGDEHIVALAGDAAFTCGITYEALNNVAHHAKRLLVVLNDNEWSIDKNTGAIASYLNRIVTSPLRLPARAHRFVEKSAKSPAAGSESGGSGQEHPVAERDLRGTGAGITGRSTDTHRP
jgi:1-deoxy-D-xylulose-5-phosphate synthase